MAYFPNGSASMDFQARECNSCIHEKPDDGGCMVWLAHLTQNYDQIVDGERDNPLAHTLSLLIDDSKPLGDMCSMRIGIETLDPGDGEPIGANLDTDTSALELDALEGAVRELLLDCDNSRLADAASLVSDERERELRLAMGGA